MQKVMKFIGLLVCLLVTKTTHCCFFDQYGNLPQVELALSSARKASTTVIAARTRDNVVVITYTPKIESIDRQVDQAPIKIHKLDVNLAAIACGLYTDCYHIINWLFEKVSTQKSVFEASQIPTMRLAALLGEYMHKKTLFPTRPFGAVVLLVGYESIKGANLIEIDPLGNCYESRFICRGPYAENISTDWTNDPLPMTTSNLTEECILSLVRAIKSEQSNDEIPPNCYAELLVLGKDFQQTRTVDVTEIICSLRRCLNGKERISQLLLELSREE